MNITLKEYLDILSCLKFPTKDSLTEYWKKNLFDNNILRHEENKIVFYEFGINEYAINLNFDITNISRVSIAKDADGFERDLLLEHNFSFVDIFIPINIDEMNQMICDDASLFILTYGRFADHIELANKFKSEFRLLKSLSKTLQEMILKKGAS